MYERLMVKKVRNATGYEGTQVKPWRQTIKIHQIKWFLHLIRLSHNTQAKTVLK